ncbi:EAL domain-containing protein [Stappia sp. F7233]|uniref:EAL domain-containing protein n=1 Tax=Stappia albiluteola TaxID=2758565 RepID=A0A839AB11_9HYPH|nr:EAL domain-containing protein [Stappia albiluteola]MBA5776850.1 EAL domain-containing protein [Stappia albiluteola]
MLRPLLLLTALILAAAGLDRIGALHPLERYLSELRFEAGRRAPSGEIVFVEIDAQSLKAIGQWPWPRSVHADLVDRLNELAVGEIAFDIDFSAHSDAGADRRFAASLQRSESTVVLAAFRQPATSGANSGFVLNRPLNMFLNSAWMADVSFALERDDRVWRGGFGHDHGSRNIPSMAAFLAGGSRPLGADFMIDFGIDADRIERVSAIDVLEGRADAAKLKARTVLIGASAQELRDLFHVPAHGVVPGGILQILAAESIAQDRMLRRTGAAPQLAALALVALVLLAAARSPLWIRLSALCSLAAAGELTAFLVQQSHPVIVATPLWLTGLGLFALFLAVEEFGLKRLLLLVAQLRTRNAETILGRVIGDSFAGILIVDRDETIMQASRSAAGILSLDADMRLQGRSIREILPPVMCRDTLRALSSRNTESRTGECELAVPGQSERILDYVVTASRLSELSERQREERQIACVTFKDVTRQRQAESRLRYLARFDPVTGALTRNALLQDMEKGECPQEGDRHVALFVVDLDRFEEIGATLGHQHADQLLEAVAGRLTEIAGPGNVAHLGGGRFAFHRTDDIETDATSRIAETAIRRLNETFDIDGNHLLVGVNIGTTIAISDAPDPAGLLRQAETALAHAKSSGVNRWQCFRSGMELEPIRRRMLELELRRAVRGRDLYLLYQPQVSILSGEVIGVEALLRWQHPHLGAISPCEFIPIAEACGLIEEIGRWTIRQACKDAAGWERPIRLAVNVSPKQFADPGLVPTVGRALETSGLAPSLLDLEVTESLFLHDCADLDLTIGKLHDLGVGLALDDFGTGYASLGYISRMPLTKIKIDKSFIDPLADEVKAQAIVRAISTLARELGLTIIAEGIETAAQVAPLREAGIEIVQGFYFHRPLPAAEIAALLATGNNVVRRIPA